MKDPIPTLSRYPLVRDLTLSGTVPTNQWVGLGGFSEMSGVRSASGELGPLVLVGVEQHPDAPVHEVPRPNTAWFHCPRVERAVVCPAQAHPDRRRDRRNYALVSYVELLGVGRPLNNAGQELDEEYPGPLQALSGQCLGEFLRVPPGR